MLDRWWKTFGDAQLASMVEQALVSAPDARTAVAVLNEARATRAAALSQFSPKGGLQGSSTYQSSAPAGSGIGTGGQSTSTVSFSPTWELGLFGRQAALRGSADADLDNARFAYEASRQSLAANVATNLFEARGLAVQLVEANETERVARELAALGQRRVEAGIGSSADAASLDTDLATATADRQSLEAQLTNSKRTLLVLLGRGSDPVDTLQVEARLGEPPAIPQTVPGELLGRRPDVRQAEAQVRSAAGKLKLDELALLPTFTLSPGATWTKVAGEAGSSFWSLGASLLLPIFDRPRLLAQIEGQRAHAEQAIIAYEKSVQTAYGEAERTMTTYMADRARLEQLDVAVRRSSFAFNAQRAGYDAGIVDLTTLLTAQRTWSNARAQSARLQTTTLTDAVNTFKALGGGWNPVGSSEDPADSRDLP